MIGMTYEFSSSNSSLSLVTGFSVTLVIICGCTQHTSPLLGKSPSLLKMCRSHCGAVGSILTKISPGFIFFLLRFTFASSAAKVSIHVPITFCTLNLLSMDTHYFLNSPVVRPVYLSQTEYDVVVEVI